MHDRQRTVWTCIGAGAAATLALVQVAIGLDIVADSDLPPRALVLGGILFCLVAGTVCSVAAILLDRPWLSLLGWSLLALTAMGYVVPWLLGDRLLHYDNIMRPWAAFPIAAFVLARSAGGGISKAEQRVWHALLGIGLLFAVMMLSFAAIWGGGNVLAMPWQDLINVLALPLFFAAEAWRIRLAFVQSRHDPLS